MNVTDLATRRRPPAGTPMSEPIPDETFARYFLTAGITPERMHGYGEHSLASAMTAVLSSRRPHLRIVNGGKQ